MHPILKSHCETGHFSRGYLLVGDRQKSRENGREAAAILLGCDVSSLDSHPDFWEQFFESFGPEESNILKQKSATKPIISEKKVFLLSVNSFDAFTSASISKIIEESPETCHFFFIATFSENVPAVLRSNLINIIEGDFKISDDKKKFYEKFLKAGPVERLSLAKNSANDKKAALDFLNELEIILSKQIKGQPLSAGLLSSLEELQKDRRYLFDRAPSPKLIIEHFALTLPQLK
jgi:hypothetical protein